MDNIVILDCGSQYTQLIARRVRELKVHSEILPYDATIEQITSRKPTGLIISGGPRSVLEPNSPRLADGFFDLKIPILGICYGMQLAALTYGGIVRRSAAREYGKAILQVKDRSCPFFEGIPEKSQVWMSHGDDVEKLPDNFIETAVSEDGVVAGMRTPDNHINAVQFHPEVFHTEKGAELLGNFLFRICGCKGDWDLGNWAEKMKDEIRAKVGGAKVICGLSGGVDSSVAAALTSAAIGDRLQCIFVNNGLLRAGEAEEVMNSYKQMKLNVTYVDASSTFLNNLVGVIDPEKKRKIIGETFIRIFEAEARKINGAKWLLQGTLYPDVIESGQRKGAAVIKSHHNVGGLPKELGFTELIEPLRMLFKDEVRALGEALGLPRELVWRQPFPGPGLAIRIIGEVTPEKAEIVRESDAIFREEIAAAGLDRHVNQYFTVLTGIQSVGVMGDERTYDYTIALRAVTTDDFMTADWARLPYDLIARVSARIVNEVPHASRVVLDVTTKPPASIEWE